MSKFSLVIAYLRLRAYEFFHCESKSSLSKVFTIEKLFLFFFFSLVRSLGTACSNKDYCSLVLCLESEAKNPFPLFSRILRLAREGLGCMHILVYCSIKTGIKKSDWFWELKAQWTYTAAWPPYVSDSLVRRATVWPQPFSQTKGVLEISKSWWELARKNHYNKQDKCG